MIKDTRIPIGFVDGEIVIIDMNNVLTISYDLNKDFQPYNGKVILKDGQKINVSNIQDIINWIYDVENSN